MTTQKLTRLQRRVFEAATATFKTQYHDGDGVPLSRSAITALTLSLKDIRTGTVINSRSAQSVLDTNNGSMPANLNLTAATQANPVVITVDASHQLETGMYLYISGVAGMTELNNRTHRVIKVSDTELALADVDGSSYAAWSSGGSCRAGLLIFDFQPADNPIVGLTINAALAADPVVVTFTTAHGLADGAEVWIEGVGGMTELNNRRFFVRKSTYNSVELLDENGESYTAYTSAGSATPIIGDAEAHSALFTLTHSGGSIPNAVQLDVEQTL